MVDFREPPRVFSLSRLLLGALVVANLGVLALLFLDRPEPSPVAAEQAVPAPDEALTLIDELDEAGRAELADADAERPPPRQSAIPDAGAGLVCKAWGPFTGDGPLAAARDAIDAVADRVDVVHSQMAAPPDFLVYIDTDNNLDNARRLLQELESQSIDAYVIAGGSFINSVSAGVFSNRDGAARLMSQLEDLGYKPRLEPLEREQEVRHLAARVPPGFELDELESRPCREIASEEDIL
jgi:cell division septation protein DedD